LPRPLANASIAMTYFSWNPTVENSPEENLGDALPASTGKLGLKIYARQFFLAISEITFKAEIPSV